MLRIMFLNTWGGTLWEPYRLYIKEMSKSVDIFCLQEVHSNLKVAPQMIMPRDAGTRTKPIYVRQLFALERILSEYNGFFAPQAQHCLHDLERTEHPVFFGNAMFVRKSIPVISFRSGMAYGQFDHLNGDRPAARSMQGALVQRSGTTFVVAHFHGIWTGGGKHDAPERIEQSNNVLDLLADLRHEGQKSTGQDPRMILGGDFNLESKTQALHLLEMGRGPGEHLINLNRRRGILDTRTSHYPSTKKSREADYVLVSQNTQVLDFQVVKTPEVSDHAPLILDCA